MQIRKYMWAALATMSLAFSGCNIAIQQKETAVETRVPVSGTIFYGTEPVHLYTDVEPFFWTRCEAGGYEVKDVAYAFDKTTSQFKINPGLKPGEYGIGIYFNINQKSPPGDLTAFYYFSVGENEYDVKLDIKESHVIHLTSPFDNENIMPEYCGHEKNLPIHRSPVHFSWEPVSDDPEYNYNLQIDKYSRSPFQRLATVVECDTNETDTDIELEASEPNTMYMFDLHGHGNVRSHLEVSGKDWHGWDYRFLVE